MMCKLRKIKFFTTEVMICLLKDNLMKVLLTIKICLQVRLLKVKRVKAKGIKGKVLLELLMQKLRENKRGIHRKLNTDLFLKIHF